MQSKLALIAPAGRNKHGQRLVSVKCSCGSPEFTVREDSFKQERTTSCGFCRKGGKRKAEPIVEPKVEQKPTPELESTFERGSVAWFDDEISRKEAALISNENHIRFLELEIAQQDETNLDTLKKRKAESTSANDLRQEISRLRIEKANAETAQQKDTKSAAELVKDRIAALKGSK
jgi:hypothetical protein